MNYCYYVLWNSIREPAFHGSHCQSESLIEKRVGHLAVTPVDFALIVTHVKLIFGQDEFRLIGFITCGVDGLWGKEGGRLAKEGLKLGV